MLMWVCDLIIASEDALFSDPTLSFGVNGVEWFAHPWELGPRKAKELLFTGDFITAAEAKERGMVNQVVPSGELAAYTVSLAERIARQSSFALKLAKMAVNQTVEAQGFHTAQKAAFNLHHLGHADIRERAARADGGGAT
jgi:enoyl-CoA hydratase